MPARVVPTHWADAPARPWLRKGQVHIWRADLAAELPTLPERAACLSAQERSAASRFHFAEDRDRWVLSRSILRHILGVYLGRGPSSIRILRGPHGKPFVADRGLRFNLSHSGDYAAYAFNADGQVGIDLERSVPLRPDELVSAGFLSEREAEGLATLGGPSLHEALLRCWTRKEAFIKATGEGMSAPLKEIDVPLASGRHSLRGALPGEAGARSWSLIDIEVAPRYAACLAVEGEPELITWDWRWPERELREVSLAGGMWAAGLGRLIGAPRLPRRGW